MSKLGNSAENQTFTPIIDTFNGNGSTTAFTLTYPVASVAQVEAYISNVPQQPGVAYTVLGNTITFTSAPPSGTANIYVRYTSPITQIMQPGAGTVGPQQLDVNASGTGAMQLPTGTTAQRPGSPINGQIRYNNTTGAVEVYTGTAWVNYAPSYSIEYLVVAGGGGGGGEINTYAGSGGGGAGGYVAGLQFVLAQNAISVTVGAGGSGGASASYATVGSNSTMTGVTTAIGGGRGAGSTTILNDYYAASSGGSGGGGLGYTYPSGAAGTAGQGNAGGSTGGGSPYAGAGGGGAGGAGVGTGSNSNIGTAGGVGLNWQALGTYYAGGGGGGGTGGGWGAGGNGGGGHGGDNSAGSATAGSANTGGGGGGSAQSNYTTGGNGGSGIVIIRYAGSQRGTGGTVTSAGGYTYHTFTSSGTFTA